MRTHFHQAFHHWGMSGGRLKCRYKHSRVLKNCYAPNITESFHRFGDSIHTALRVKLTSFKKRLFPGTQKLEKSCGIVLLHDNCCKITLRHGSDR